MVDPWPTEPGLPVLVYGFANFLQQNPKLLDGKGYLRPSKRQEEIASFCF